MNNDNSQSTEVRRRTFNSMAFDILENVLHSADNPAECSAYIVEQLREVTGARTVIIFQCLHSLGGKGHRVINISPERRKSFSEKSEIKRLIEIVHDQIATIIWQANENGNEAEKIFASLAYDTSLAVPLQVGSHRIGAILALDLPVDPQNIPLVAEVVSMLATVVALVFRNALLFEQQENIINERTKKIQESEQLFRGLARMAPVGIFRTDSAGDCIYVNETWRTISGMSKKQASGKGWIEALHPEDRQRVSDEWYNSTFNNTIFSSEYRFLKPDGTTRWLFGQAIAELDEHDEIKGYIGTITDITDHKKSEEHLKKWAQIFKNSEWGIVVEDPEGKTLELMNPAFAFMHGYTVKELTGQPQTTVFAPQSRLSIPEHIKIAREKKHYSFEAEHIRKDGTIFPVLIDVTAVNDSEGNTLYLVFNVQDISLQKRTEQEKRQLENRLQQAQKMEAIGTLAGGIAHDFNNILSAVIGYTDLALEDVPPESRIAEMLTEVQKAGDRAKELVKQILTFSRQTESEKKPIQIHLIVKEAIKLLRASIPSTIEIKHNITTDCGLVLADPTQIHQIVMNLCTNAYHAMQDKGGILALEMHPKVIDPENSKVTSLELNPGPYVKLMVSDTGCGMDKLTLHRIFEPYFTTKEKGKGTGLGLAVVHGIIKDHNGLINAYSEPGKGSTFTIFLPQIKSAHRDIVKERIEPLPRGQEHILFVDDEKAITEIGARMLEGLGYTVTSTTSSQEAYEMLHAQPNMYDLVITDMTMPHMTGAELSQKLLHDKPTLPIILCTGFSELINAERAEQIGIRGFLQKPVTKKDLAHSVKKLLSGDDNSPTDS